jgi:uncharacterized protein YeaO (DUF488 family)
MLKQLNFKNLRQQVLEDPGALFYLVARGGLDYLRFDQIRKCPVLAPSDKLARMFRIGDISESEFRNKYAHELQSPIVRELMKCIRTEVQDKDVYLVENSKDDHLLLFDILDHFK